MVAISGRRNFRNRWNHLETGRIPLGVSHRDGKARQHGQQRQGGRRARGGPNLQKKIVRIGDFFAGLGLFVAGIGVLKIPRAAAQQRIIADHAERRPRVLHAIAQRADRPQPHRPAQHRGNHHCGRHRNTKDACENDGVGVNAMWNRLALRSWVACRHTAQPWVGMFANKRIPTRCFAS